MSIIEKLDSTDFKRQGSTIILYWLSYILADIHELLILTGREMFLNIIKTK